MDMSANYPTGRKEIYVDVLKSAEKITGFDEEGSASYLASEFTQASGSAGVYDSCTAADYYAWKDGALYAYSGVTGISIGTFPQMPSHVRGSALGGKDCDLFIGDGKLLIFGGTESEVKTDGEYDGMENAYKNMQVRVSGGKVYLSAPYNPSVFSCDAGGAEFLPPATAGKALRAVEADDALCIFCERGIWKLTYHGDAEKAALTLYPALFEALIPASVQSVGKKSFFVTTAGRLYGFDGSLEVLCPDVGIDSEDVKSTVNKTAYVLAFGNRILIYDAETKKIARVETPAAVTAADGRYLVAGSAYGLSRVSDGGGKIRTKPLDFGTGELKKICRLSFEGEGRIELTVIGDRDVKTYSLECGQTAFPKISGRKFAFEIGCPAGARVEKLRAVYTPTGVK